MSEKKVTFEASNVECELDPRSSESEDDGELGKRQFNKFQLLNLVEGEDVDDDDDDAEHFNETHQGKNGGPLADDGTSSDTDEVNNEDECTKKTSKAPRDQNKTIPNIKRKLRKKRIKNKSSSRKTDGLFAELKSQLELMSLNTDDNNSSQSATGMTKYKLLKVDMRNLMPEAELKRIFGKSVVKEDKSRRKIHPNNNHQRSRFVTLAQFEIKPASPFTGPKMEIDDTINNVRNVVKEQERSAGRSSKSDIIYQSCSDFSEQTRPIYFKFVHEKPYQDAQRLFLEAVNRGNTDYIIHSAQSMPLHAESLIQLSHMIRVSEDYKTASECIERALVVFEMGFHPRFNVTTATCRLSYKRPENRTFFITIFKHIISCHRRGLRRTPFEYSKLLLSLEPDNDPLMAVQFLDFFAIRCAEYDYLLDYYNLWESNRKLPNLSFSRALAQYFKSRCTKSTKADNEAMLNLADDYLKQALLLFPNFIIPLLDACSGEPEIALRQCKFFDYSVYGTNYKLVPETVEVLVNLYVKRCYSLWKHKLVLTWLERNVAEMVAMFASGELTDKGEHIEHWSKFPKVVPKILLRHLVLSDLDMTIPPSASKSAYIDIDPYPPSDSIVTYDTSMNATSQPTTIRSAGHVFDEVSSLFFRSILPSFSLTPETPPSTTSAPPQPRVEHQSVRSNDRGSIPDAGISGLARQIAPGIEIEREGFLGDVAPDDQGQESRAEEQPSNSGERRRRQNRGRQSGN